MLTPDDLRGIAEEPVNHPEHDLEMVGLRCLADIRAAVGDSGRMMQRELVAHIAGLARDAARYRWLRGREGGRYLTLYAFRTDIDEVCLGDELDAVIDAAMAKESSE